MENATRRFVRNIIAAETNLKTLHSHCRHKMDVANVVYDARRVELKREKLSIMLLHDG